MKVIDSNKTYELLAPKQDYLRSAGIHSVITRDTVNIKMHGPYELRVEDEDYENAIRALEEIDTYAFVDEREEDKEIRETRERIDSFQNFVVMLARMFLIAMAAGLIYLVITT